MRGFTHTLAKISLVEAGLVVGFMIGALALGAPSAEGASGHLDVHLRSGESRFQGDLSGLTAVVHGETGARRSGVGRYLVYLQTIRDQDSLQDPEHFQVTAIGSDDTACKVRRVYRNTLFRNTTPEDPWSLEETRIVVECYDSAGRFHDSRFHFFAAGHEYSEHSGWDSVPPQALGGAYLFAHDVYSAGWYAASESWNHAKGVNRVRNVGRGQYLVSLGRLRAASDCHEADSPRRCGNAVVTAYGEDSVACKVTTWFPGKGSDQNQYARVHCFDISGRPSNSRFFLSYIDENPAQRCAGFAGTVCPAGFLLADGPFTPIVYQPSPSSPPIVLDDRLYPATGDQGNAEGRLSHVSRRGTGRYAATVWGRFYGVQVTSYGEGATRCKLASFPDDPTLGDSFDVACFAASGEPTDSAFAIRDVAD